MLAEKFDPYGELLPDDAGGKAYVTKATSVLLSRIGQLVFWALAIGYRLRSYPVLFGRPLISEPDGRSVVAHAGRSSGKLTRSNSIFSKTWAAGIAMRPGSLICHRVRSMMMPSIKMVFSRPS